MGYRFCDILRNHFVNSFCDFCDTSPEAKLLLKIICSAATYISKSVEYASEVYKETRSQIFTKDAAKKNCSSFL
jgi:hypothetical protein